MKYYWITAELAEKLNVASYRKGSKDKGYLVTSGDLAAYGLYKAIDEGAKEFTDKDAQNFLKIIER